MRCYHCKGTIFARDLDGEVSCITCSRVQRPTPPPPAPVLDVDHCPNGHPFTDDNVRLRRDRAGVHRHRECRECHRERNRVGKALRRARERV